MPALGFGTLIPEPAVTIAATRDAVGLDFGISIAQSDTGTSA